MTAFDHALLQGELERLGLPALSEEKMAQLENYAEFLVSFNSHTNLTAITDPEGIALLHFADSLSLFLSGHPAGGEKICDVGSGAGCRLNAGAKMGRNFRHETGRSVNTDLPAMLYKEHVCNKSTSAKRNKYVNFFENVLTTVLL